MSAVTTATGQSTSKSMIVETLPESVDVLIVGGGHAGLAMSGLLTPAGREHLVVERRARLGGGWQDCWDEFRLVTPNWTASFPGWDYAGADPDGFMSRDEITARVAQYADIVGAPAALDTEIHRVTPVRGGFRATTSRGLLTARQVVVATGSYHTPRVPQLAHRITDRVTQIHSHHRLAFARCRNLDHHLGHGLCTRLWWIDVPILDELGYPRHVRGVAAVPGLYFLGLLWQHSQASASLVGPEFDGPYLVDQMARMAV
jgi:hypothetical protein